jgi:hypothetical protein
VKPNEPTFFQEFGPPGYHTFFGFVSPSTIGTPPGPGGSTVTGRVTNMHMSRPPTMQLHDAGTKNAMAHTTAWVGLNSANGSGPNIAVVKADSDTGDFSIPNVPAGTYQLVVWDDYLDQIIAYKTVTLPAGATVGNVPVFQWFARLENNVFLDDDEDGQKDDGEAPLIEQNINLRFRDGSIYQSFPTDHTGFVPFDEVFPFFNWLVAEVDYGRFKPTGVTVTVDAGGALPTPGGDDSILTPQNQIPCAPGHVCTATTRTETGPQLLQAFQGFIGQTSVLDWGKAPYQPGENGGISGVVYYASTRAENDPRLAAADTWEPGIPRVKVRLYRRVPVNGSATTTTLALVEEVQTDSWDDSVPTGCPGAARRRRDVSAEPDECYDGLRNFNQVRPGVRRWVRQRDSARLTRSERFSPGYSWSEDKNVDFGDAHHCLIAPMFGWHGVALPDQAMVACSGRASRNCPAWAPPGRPITPSRSGPPAGDSRPL